MNPKEFELYQKIRDDIREKTGFEFIEKEDCLLWVHAIHPSIRPEFKESGLWLKIMGVRGELYARTWIGTMREKSQSYQQYIAENQAQKTLEEYLKKISVTKASDRYIINEASFKKYRKERDDF